MKDIEDTVDIYVKARVGEEVHQTDIHYRSQDGTGSFNWRMKFRFKLKRNNEDPRITF